MNNNIKIVWRKIRSDARKVSAEKLKIQKEQDLLAISQWKEVKVLEQNLQSDYVHLVCSIPPKISVSDFMVNGGFKI